MKDIGNKSFIKGFKFRCYPTQSQIELLDKSFGCMRWTWNRALDESIKQYELFKETQNPLDKPNLSGFGLILTRLNHYKRDPEFTWLYNVSSQALQQNMLNLGKAFTNFFNKGSGYPKFKKKYGKQSLTLTPGYYSFRKKGFYFAKSHEPLAINFHRELPSKPKNVVISKSTTGKYYISFTCEYIPLPTNGNGIIGMDLGLKALVTTSNGVKYENPKHLKKHERNLKRKQQSLARCKNGSIKRSKAKQKVALIHERITNQRNDFLHKVSRTLVNENQVIGIESLRVKNMIKNRRLSKAISDASWSKFIEYLTYKAIESQHCNVIKIDSFYPSSHICSICNQKLDRKLKLSEREWICPHCGSCHDRDINAALNIKHEAIRLVKQQFNIDLVS